MLLKVGDTPNENYDLIVIGGGLGGLTVANILGRSGKKVLLVESHNKLGGLATWFKRSNTGENRDKSDDHFFDISLHGFPYGMIKSFKRYFGKEISDRVVPLTKMKFINPQFSLLTSYTREHFTSLMQEHFKLPLKQIEKFFDETFAYSKDSDSTMSAYDYLNGHFPNRMDILRFLMEPITYANGHTLEDPALTYSIVFSNFMKHGIYTFQGGTDLLIKMIREELLSNGVDLKLHTKVEKIAVSGDKKVEGIYLGNKLIKAPIVVSNSNLLSTITSLTGEEHFSPSFLSKVKSVRLNTSSCQVYIGIKRGEELPEIGDLIFYSEDPLYDTNRLLAPDTKSRTFSIYYPEGRPEHGRYAVVVSSNALYEDWSNLDKKSYDDKKNLLIEETLSAFEKILPKDFNLREKIDHLEAATPLTIERFTHHLKGSAFGTKFEGLEVSQKLPSEIEGLYHCGSVGIIMSGWLGSVNYGVITANKIEEQFARL